MNMNTNANTNMNRMKCLVERWGDMEWTDGSKKCDANAGVVLVSSRYFAAFYRAFVLFLVATIK